MRGNTRRLLSLLLAVAMVASVVVMAPSTEAAASSTGVVMVDEDFSGRVLDENWVKQSNSATVGNFLLTGGAIQYHEETAVNAGALYYSGLAMQNFDITFDVTASDSATTGHWFEVYLSTTTGSDGYRVRFGNYGSTRVFMYDPSGSYSDRTSASKIFDAAAHTITISVSGTTITTYLDGTKIDTYTRDAVGTRSLGSIGLRCDNYGYIFDNIKVTCYDASAVKPLENVVLSEDFAAKPSTTYWTDAGSAYSVNDDGALQLTGSAGQAIYYKYGYWEDFELSFDLKFPSSGSGNWFRVNLYDGSGSLVGPYVYFRGFSNVVALCGGSSEKTGGSSALWNGEWHHIRVVRSGSTITVYDGVSTLITRTDDAYVTDPCTIGFSVTGTDYALDNVKVTVPMEHMEEVLSEDFSDAATKGAWEFREIASGTYDYTDGKLTYTNVSGSGGGVARYKGDSWTNFEVTAKVKFPSSGWFQIGLRSTTDESNLMGNYLYFSTFKSGAKYLELYGADGAVVTPVYQVSCGSYFDGNEHEIRVQIVDSSMWVYVDGNLIYVAADASLKDNEGSVSFKTYVTGVTFDDVQVISYDLPDLKFSGASLYLQSNLAIHYRVDAKLFAEGKYTGPYLVVEMNGKQQTITEYTLDTAKDQYVFQFSNIAPQQMGDTVTATLHATYEGQEYTVSKDYSVKQYCYSMLNNETYATDAYAELRTLLVDLLNYGAAAQTYKNYNTGALVNAELTETQAAWGTAELATALEDHKSTVTDKEDATVAWAGAGLYLENEVAIRLRFVPNDGVDVTGLTVQVATADGSKTWTIGAEAFVAAEAGGCYVYFDSLNAAQMREALTIQICDSEGAVISDTICYSIVSYAHSRQNDTDAALVALLDAMMKYGDSACAYVTD